MGSMMTNPAMKEMVRSQTRMQLDMRYERLIKFFNLSPEAAEKFKALLMDRQMAMMDSGFAFMDQNMSDEDRNAHAEKMRRTTEDYAQQLKELLGPENYESFQQYEQTEPERMQVDMFKHSLTGGDALTEQQEYDLVNAMYKVRSSSHSSLLNRNPNDPPDPETFSEEGIKTAMADMKKMNEEYAKAAQAILSPAQFASYQRHAEQQQAMQEMGMKFAAQMFGGDKADAKPK